MQNKYTVAYIRKHYPQQFVGVSASADLDVEILLCEVLKKNRAWLRAWPDYVLTDGERETFDALMARRREGEPVAYIVGQREFWSIPLRVSVDTLIPRPETELLVESVLKLADPMKRPLIIDAGTGAGPIAIALASERSDARIVAVDRSWGALRIAAENARRQQLTNVYFCQSDWLQPFADACCDILVSNPPYIDPDDEHLGRGDIRFEPHSALVSAKRGLEDIEKLIEQSLRVVRKNGYVIFEHGWQQGSDVNELFKQCGFLNIQLMRDWSDRERATLAQVP